MSRMGTSGNYIVLCSYFCYAHVMFDMLILYLLCSYYVYAHVRFAYAVGLGGKRKIYVLDFLGQTIKFDLI